MANHHLRNHENVPGRFYVDDTCIDCDMCRSIAPAIFRRVDAEGYSAVWRQPVTPEEVALAAEAEAQCPCESIGSDGAEVGYAPLQTPSTSVGS